MPSVDIHQHLWPEPFVAQLSRRSAPPFLDGAVLVLEEGRFELDLAEHELERRLAALERNNTELAVVSLQPTLGVDGLSKPERDALEEAWIGGMRELVTAAGGRLSAFAPGRALDGFAGASVGAGALADLDAHAPLLDELERRGAVLFVHPGAVAERRGAPPWWSSVVDYTAQMQAAYFAWLGGARDRWPSLRVVFAILAGGAPFQLERLGPRGVDVRSALDPHLFLDVATYGRRSIELCIETFGVGQLVYGSDVPVVDPARTRAVLDGFGESVARLIHTDNPTRLLT